MDGMGIEDENRVGSFGKKIIIGKFLSCDAHFVRCLQEPRKRHAILLRLMYRWEWEYARGCIIYLDQTKKWLVVLSVPILQLVESVRTMAKTAAQHSLYQYFVFLSYRYCCFWNAEGCSFVRQSDRDVACTEIMFLRHPSALLRGPTHNDVT